MIEAQTIDDNTVETEAILYVNDNKLIIEFGNDRNVVMSLEKEGDEKLVSTMLGDPNFWASFLGSMSAAIEQHR